MNWACKKQFWGHEYRVSTGDTFPLPCIVRIDRGKIDISLSCYPCNTAITTAPADVTCNFRLTFTVVLLCTWNSELGARSGADSRLLKQRSYRVRGVVALVIPLLSRISSIDQSGVQLAKDSREVVKLSHLMSLITNGSEVHGRKGKATRSARMYTLPAVRASLTGRLTGRLSCWCAVLSGFVRECWFSTFQVVFRGGIKYLGPHQL